MKVIDYRRVILHVDPLCHHHGGGHDLFQHRTVWIFTPIVIMQKTSSLQIKMTRGRPRRNDESGIVGQPPFGPEFRPITGASLQGAVELGVIHGFQSQCRCAAPSGQLTSFCQPGRECIGQQVFGVINVVGDGVVQSGHKLRFFRNGNTQSRQVFPQHRCIEQIGQYLGIGQPRLATACAAVQARCMGIVTGRTTVTHQ